MTNYIDEKETIRRDKLKLDQLIQINKNLDQITNLLGTVLLALGIIMGILASEFVF